MKAVKILMMAGAMAIATPAFAQFSNASTGARSNGGSSMVKDTTPYDRISLSYQYDMMKLDVKDADDQNLNGVAIDYIHGFSVSKTLPIFIETGIGFNVGFWGDSDNDYKMTTPSGTCDAELKNNLTTLSVSIPVNVAYKFNINNDFSIHPYLGLNLKFNALAQNKYKFDCEDSDIQDDVDDLSDKEFEDSFGVPRSYSMFDKDYTGKDGQWKRFQLGWHIGVGVNYKAFYVGLSYGTDFMELAKKLNTSTFKIGVGYNF